MIYWGKGIIMDMYNWLDYTVDLKHIHKAHRDHPRCATQYEGSVTMDFFNDLGKKFSNVARSVTEKTKESVEVTRISGDLRSIRNELEQIYTEYGKVCYDVHMGVGSQSAADALAKHIQNTLERISELNAQRDEMRAVRRCASCGAVQPKDSRFCASCGKRMPEDAPVPEPEEVAEDAEFCTECGAMKEPESRFCTVCGKSYEPDASEVEETPEAEDVEPIVQVDAEEPDQFEETRQD